MSGPAGNVNIKALTKKDLIVNALVEKIEGGEIAVGERLAGENVLASEFHVSRGTVRQALGELQRRRLITTRSGFGSVVIYDGHKLDQGSGWTAALSDISGNVVSQLLRIEVVPRWQVPDLPASVRGDDFVLVERRRRTAARGRRQRVVSLERAYVSNGGFLTTLPAHGLLQGSLTVSLAHAGLEAVTAERSVSLKLLDAEEADRLGRAVGAPFLRTVRTSFTLEGGFVEHVVSLLDPEHFTVSSKSGPVT
jgi:GntR family transcriptional regulator